MLRKGDQRDRKLPFPWQKRPPLLRETKVTQPLGWEPLTPPSCPREEQARHLFPLLGLVHPRRRELTLHSPVAGGEGCAGLENFSCLSQPQHERWERSSRGKTGKIQRSPATFKTTVDFGSDPPVSIVKPPKTTSPLDRWPVPRKCHLKEGGKGVKLDRKAVLGGG